MGREMGGRFRREGICVHLWLIHVRVWQKTTKFCKAVIFQLKKIKIKAFRREKKRRKYIKGKKSRNQWNWKKKKPYRNFTEPESRGKEAERSGDAKCEDWGSEREECPSVLPGLCGNTSPLGVFLTLTFCLSTELGGWYYFNGIWNLKMLA